MTNGPIEQPMNNAALQAAISSLVTTVQQTSESARLANESVQTLRGDIETGFDRIQQQIDSNAKSIEALTNKEASTAARCKQVDDVVADHVFDRLERIENSLRLLANFAFRHEVKFVEIEERLSELEGEAA